MTTSELIQRVGDENCMVQWLPVCMHSINTRKKLTEITFGTNAISASEVAAMAISGSTPQRVGLIVWLPMDKLPDDLRKKLAVAAK